MTTRKTFLAASGAAIAAASIPNIAAAQTAKANVLLVHGRSPMPALGVW